MTRRIHLWRGLRDLALCALLATGSCSAQRSELPPLASPPTGEHRVGEIVWFDLLVDDPEAAEKFYGALFGWTFEPARDGEYRTIVHRGRPIGGIIHHVPENDSEPDDIWLPSLSVGNVDQVASQATTAGGTVLLPAKNVGKRGRVAILRDPEGATFVIMRSAGGDPSDTPVQAGDFLWSQLWVRDHQPSMKFYDEIAGWKVHEVVDHDGVEEGVFESNGYPVAGLIELPWNKVRPNWLPYVRVDDVDAAVNETTKQGGRVLVRGEHLAILQDPGGAAIGVGLLPKRTDIGR